MKHSMKKIIILTSLILTTACSHMGTKRDYMRTKSYQNRKELSTSELLSGGEGVQLKQKDINTLLSRKVTYKRPLKVAVVKLGHNISYAGDWREKSLRHQATKKNTEAFRKVLKQSRYIKDISIVPEFLMPTDQSIRSLRNVAAWMQADLLLVMKTQSDADYTYKLVRENEAKAVATMESIVVDVKTGVIPFTSISTETAFFKRNKKDFSNKELRTRTILAAEDKAIIAMAEDIGTFFN